MNFHCRRAWPWARGALNSLRGAESAVMLAVDCESDIARKERAYIPTLHEAEHAQRSLHAQDLDALPMAVFR
jgi:hypothetical protein